MTISRHISVEKENQEKAGGRTAYMTKDAWSFTVPSRKRVIKRWQ